MNDWIIRHIDSFWLVVDAITRGFYDQLHKGSLIRRGLLGIAAYMQVYALLWCFEYATTSTHDPLAIAAVIGALLTPVSALFAAAIKFYNDARKNYTPHKEDKE
jgi:hypothetical protein